MVTCHVTLQQAVVLSFGFLLADFKSTAGASRSKSIRRISVLGSFFCLLDFDEKRLRGDTPLFSLTGACGAAAGCGGESSPPWLAPPPPAPAVAAASPPVRSMTYVNSGPSPQPDMTFFVTETCERRVGIFPTLDGGKSEGF